MPSTPRKGDLIINPRTQRPVRVGGRTWRGLVKDGLIEGRYRSRVTIAAIKEDIPVDKQIASANESLPPTEHAVRGRGIHKGKLVRRKKAVSQMEWDALEKNPPKLHEPEPQKLKNPEPTGAKRQSSPREPPKQRRDAVEPEEIAGETVVCFNWSSSEEED